MNRGNADANTDTPVRGAYDVLIVGAGPVGLTTAILLGARGCRVGVVERWRHRYPLPRAVVFDHEVARILASLGLAEFLPTVSEPAVDYVWHNGTGETLIQLKLEDTSYSGWPVTSLFTQPRLEAALEERARSTPGVDILRGREAVDLVADASGVRLTVAESDGHGPVLRNGVRQQHDLRATYLVGCDGANSFVRSRMNVPITDLGFHFDWLVMDVIPEDQNRVWSPRNLQVCDPARPRTVISGGPGRRRWEFMRLPCETVDELNREDKAWELLRPYDIYPGNARLERHAVYTFQARWVDTWRKGRILLAGDAAHQMPPFAGQGMCSGIRDAANLSWKLALVLSGDAQDTLLDTYTTERSQHVQYAIQASVYLGRIICEPDPAKAAERDARLRAHPAQGSGPLAHLVPPHRLTGGLLMCDQDGTPRAPAGLLARQGRVRFQGRTGLLDQCVGTGFTLMAAEDPHGVLDESSLAWCKQVGMRLLTVTENPAANGPADVVDLDGVYLPHLAESGQTAWLVRPDYYVFGGATHLHEVPHLVAALRKQLAGRTVASETSHEARTPM